MDLMDAFVAKWTHPEYPPTPISTAEFDAASRRLGIVFPQSLRSALTSYGAASPTLALLNAIVHRKLPLADISDFLTPDEMEQYTRDYCLAGMPNEMVVFATDCMGNVFIVDRRSPSAIQFFDHDFCTVDLISPNFETWLSTYLDIEGSWRDIVD